MQLSERPRRKYNCFSIFYDKIEKLKWNVPSSVVKLWPYFLSKYLSPNSNDYSRPTSIEKVSLAFRARCSADFSVWAYEEKKSCLLLSHWPLFSVLNPSQKLFNLKDKCTLFSDVKARFKSSAMELLRGNGFIRFEGALYSLYSFLG